MDGFTVSSSTSSAAQSSQAAQLAAEAAEASKNGRDDDGDSDDRGVTVSAPTVSPTVNTSGQKIGQIINVAAS